MHNSIYAIVHLANMRNDEMATSAALPHVMSTSLAHHHHLHHFHHPSPPAPPLSITIINESRSIITSLTSSQNTPPIDRLGDLFLRTGKMSPTAVTPLRPSTPQMASMFKSPDYNSSFWLENQEVGDVTGISGLLRTDEMTSSVVGESRVKCQCMTSDLRRSRGIFHSAASRRCAIDTIAPFL